MALLILLVIAAGILAVLYIRYRGENIPIGHIGVVEFMGARTRRVFGEGRVFAPPLCKIVPISVLDRSIELPKEDTLARDGFSIVLRNARVRYRLKQAHEGEEGESKTRKFRFNTSLFRRFMPYKMDDMLARYLNVEGIIDRQLTAEAQGAISLFTATVNHDGLLGFHVIKLIDFLITGDGVPGAQAEPDLVRKTRADLQEAVCAAINKAFSDVGVEDVSLAFADIDPSAANKKHIEDTIARLQEVQSERIATVVQVKQMLTLADAITAYQKEHPDFDIKAVFQLMRDLEIRQIAAEKTGILGVLIQGLSDLVASKVGTTLVEVKKAEAA